MPEIAVPETPQPFDDTLTQPIDMRELLAARD